MHSNCRLPSLLLKFQMLHANAWEHHHFFRWLKILYFINISFSYTSLHGGFLVIRFNESCSNISVTFWLVTNKCFFSLRCYACWLIMLAYVNAFARLHLIDVIINQPKYVGMHFFTPCSPRIHMHLIYLERYPYVRREAFTIN